MGRPPWTSTDQFAWLENNISQFFVAQKKNTLPSFYGTVLKEFLDRFGYDEGPGVPSHDKQRTTLEKRIRHWFGNHTRKSVVGVSKPRLGKGMLKLGKRSQKLHPYQAYMKLFCKKLRPIINERYDEYKASLDEEDEPIDKWPFTIKLVQELLSAESDDVKAEVERARDDNSDFDAEALVGVSSESPEAKEKQTGLDGSVIIGGKHPRTGEAMIYIYHHCKTTDGELTWEEATPDFKEKVEAHFGQFIVRCDPGMKKASEGGSASMDVDDQADKAEQERLLREKIDRNTKLVEQLRVGDTSNSDKTVSSSDKAVSKPRPKPTPIGAAAKNGATSRVASEPLPHAPPVVTNNINGGGGADPSSTRGGSLPPSSQHGSQPESMQAEPMEIEPTQTKAMESKSASGDPTTSTAASLVPPPAQELQQMVMVPTPTSVPMSSGTSSPTSAGTSQDPPATDVPLEDRISTMIGIPTTSNRTDPSPAGDNMMDVDPVPTDSLPATAAWMVAAEEYLMSVSTDPTWWEVVRQWKDYEKRLGYPTGNVPANYMPAGHRPAEVQNWIKAHRNYEKPPDLSDCLPSFIAKFKLWYSGIQPGWRQTEEDNWPPAQVEETEEACSDWSVLRRGGQNGFFMVIMAVSWWYSTAMLIADPDLLVQSFLIIQDIQWVLSRMGVTGRDSTAGVPAGTVGRSGKPPSSRKRR
ncbi:hypothetical protein EUX98_g8887 [Antrodiella citrinella]|uniref:Uncharacterized protein n=1 Tax=Antrodiella citrinella TaxID=2447956 RepID=A0A4S4M2T3_9APHY|nr:hypothetical protein EUX98_g8887 [Antrodiella citrinella]